MPRAPSAPPLIVLASTSPRRIELMGAAGFQFDVESPRTDEIMDPREKPAAMVRRLAYEKASAVQRRVAPRAPYTLVIAADTTVVAPNGRTILNKPESDIDARRMLRMLGGREHTVLTGYCILAQRDGCVAKPLLRVVTSRVLMRKLSTRDIDAYIRTREPMDKAGAYAAQGIGMAMIDSIRGSYTNVVGLPMCQLLADLEESFGLSLFDPPPRPANVAPAPIGGEPAAVPAPTAAGPLPATGAGGGTGGNRRTGKPRRVAAADRRKPR